MEKLNFGNEKQLNVPSETLNLPYQLSEFMAVKSKFFFFFFFMLLLAGCKPKKKPSLSGEEPVEISDFIDFFPETNLPYQFADTSLDKKDKDSLLISYKVFSQFVPDSVSQKLFGKGVKPKLYPLAKAVTDNREETYLFVKAVTSTTRSAVVIAFNKKNEFAGGMELLKPDKNPSTQQTSGMDRRFTLFKNVFRKNSDGSTSEGKDVYMLNREAKGFILIMTDPLDDKITELINPIDTFSRKLKYTADYGSGKMNLVSIRDGRKKGTLTFFIHFEKNNGACTGELKGDATIKSATVAEYRENGEPCSLRFTFTSSSVTVKELGGCGARRGLRCSFDGTYPRKKEVKPKQTKAK
jgi:hypothetical protein